MTGETKNRHKMNLVKMNLAKIEPFEKAVIKKLAKLATVSHFCGLKKAFSRNLARTNCIKFRFYNKCWGQAMSLAPMS